MADAKTTLAHVLFLVNRYNYAKKKGVVYMYELDKSCADRLVRE